MRLLLRNIFYSFPIQLFILHFRKYQVLLFFWYIVFSTINSGFMKFYGADALFFTPEYLGSVNIIGAVLVGVAFGVFFMSWNITTFILHSKRFKFLATTSNPFLKYCINNAILPLLFLIFYFVKMYRFNEYKELMNAGQIISIMSGVLLGNILLIAISFAYFFGAGKTINRTMVPIISNPELFRKTYAKRENIQDEFGLKVLYYFTGRFKLKKPRQVGHYRQDFLDTIFKRHHIAAIASIMLAFFFLVIVGFLLDNKYFEMPAAASILVFFALMIALIGALTYFLQSWSLPAAILLIVIINVLYKKEIIDPRNKAYGLDYNHKELRPDYNKAALQALCNFNQQEADRENMVGILDRWKQKQTSAKPVMVFINVSGGGLRSAAFTMNALQQLDSISGGKLMQHCFLFSGASGGMLAATYYRELYRKKFLDSNINLHDKRFTNDIADDLLNPVFSSMIARDLFAPGQKFSVDSFLYVKDRGYAFERKLSQNTHGVLQEQLKDAANDEAMGKVPLLIFNAVIKSDGRKLVIGTQPLSFMMKPYSMHKDSASSPDAVDFGALFKKQQPMNMRMLTALRMNATFPYVLPNVWLPSNPVIDVMDAGLRDNYGQETTLRFIDNFKEWITQNTGGVVILQLRDRLNDNWQQPFETNSLTDMMITPATMLSHNWPKLQDYFQADQYSYFKERMDSSLYKISIMYIPEVEEKGATLNFHLSAREKRDVMQSFYHKNNIEALKQIAELLKD
ncbi:MAG: patatin-like phospholipase family protein [Ferruginibacter sp.]